MVLHIHIHGCRNVKIIAGAHSAKYQLPGTKGEFQGEFSMNLLGFKDFPKAVSQNYLGAHAPSAPMVPTPMHMH